MVIPTGFFSINKMPPLGAGLYGIRDNVRAAAYGGSSISKAVSRRNWLKKLKLKRRTIKRNKKR